MVMTSLRPIVVELLLGSNRCCRTSRALTRYLFTAYVIVKTQEQATCKLIHQPYTRAPIKNRRKSTRQEVDLKGIMRTDYLDLKGYLLVLAASFFLLYRSRKSVSALYEYEACDVAQVLKDGESPEDGDEDGTTDEGGGVEATKKVGQINRENLSGGESQEKKQHIDAMTCNVDVRVSGLLPQKHKNCARGGKHPNKNSF
jgi:hypothetical protein